MAPTPPQASSTQGAAAAANGGSSETQSSSSLPPSSSVGDHLAQALKDLARGEQTATALEANLSSLESKLDAILAGFGLSSEELDALAEPDGQEKKEEKEGDVKGAAADAESKKGDA